ncbi:hypothetical protein AMTRI_Chr11g94120 [Amborella trichopoda]
MAALQKFLSSSATSQPAFLSPLLWRFFSSGNERCPNTLSYEEIQVSENPCKDTAFIFHGLLGSDRNWWSFSRRLLSSFQSRSNWRMVLVDLRNHGKSAEIEGFDPPHTMKSAALDVAIFLKSKSWSWPDVVICHSLGGNIALAFAVSCAQGDCGESATLPKQLWVLDSLPGEVNPSDVEVGNVLRTVQSIPVPIPLRSKESYWPLLENPPQGLEIKVVRKRTVVGDKQGKGNVSYHILKEAGHWVHVDNPKGLIDIMGPIQHIYQSLELG